LGSFSCGLPMPILSIRNLSINYQSPRGLVRAIRNVSMDLHQDEAFSLVGESGSGKTTLALSMLRLLPDAASIYQGRIFCHFSKTTDPLQATDLLSLDCDSLRRFRWERISLVFQSALNVLNPVMRISAHFKDTARAHNYLHGEALTRRAKNLLTLMRLDADHVWRAFPHELSGGMRQRVLIALALLLEPNLLILDEPTSALDVLTQKYIVGIVQDLRQELSFSLVFISHHIALAAELSDRMATMYAGKIIEVGPASVLRNSPCHPYTMGLMRAVPTLTGPLQNCQPIPGAPPDPINLLIGCKFHPRCSFSDERCRYEEPELELVETDHRVACWNWQRLKRK
jgi:peptide/nickel transport system ATP-binding protein